MKIDIEQKRDDGKWHYVASTERHNTTAEALKAFIDAYEGPVVISRFRARPTSESRPWRVGPDGRGAGRSWDPGFKASRSGHG